MSLFISLDLWDWAKEGNLVRAPKAPWQLCCSSPSTVEIRPTSYNRRGIYQSTSLGARQHHPPAAPRLPPERNLPVYQSTSLPVYQSTSLPPKTFCIPQLSFAPQNARDRAAVRELPAAARGSTCSSPCLDSDRSSLQITYDAAELDVKHAVRATAGCYQGPCIRTWRGCL